MRPSSSSSSEPLLTHPPTTSSQQQSSTNTFIHVYRTLHRQTHGLLSSRYQHYIVLSLVTFDLLGIFAAIIIELCFCKGEITSPVWNDVQNGLEIAGLVFSCLFMLELVLSLWVFGWRYLSTPFHLFDSTVILLAFITDVLLRGVLEEVGSLVILLRLWRFFKIIEEFSVGAQERMDDLEARVLELERENGELKREVEGKAHSSSGRSS